MAVFRADCGGRLGLDTPEILAPIQTATSAISGAVSQLSMKFYVSLGNEISISVPLCLLYVRHMYVKGIVNQTMPALGLVKSTSTPIRDSLINLLSLFYWAILLLLITATGASKNELSSAYCGPRAWSEQCVVNIAQTLQALKSRLKVYMTLHSYGQMWFVPYAWSRTAFPSDYNKLVRNDESGCRTN